MGKHRFEFRHTTDPHFLAAVRFYGAVTTLPALPGSRAPRDSLERAARQIANCIAEAVDLTEVSPKRWATALQCCSKASSTLLLMRSRDFVDESAHQHALKLLAAVAGKLEALRKGSNASTPAAETSFEDEQPEGPRLDGIPTSDGETQRPTAATDEPVPLTSSG